MSCINCGRGFHEECETKCEKCHPKPEKTEEPISGKLGRPEKKFNEITDPKSTGRKRAARLYPIRSDQPCEWRGLKNCGGGLKPIVGCLDGVQRQRHHGPIKDPRHNEEGNVHRICTKCHRRWHAANDPIYNESDYALLPHAPVKATAVEIADSDLKWRGITSGTATTD